jgi:hypothetical protein
VELDSLCNACESFGSKEGEQGSLRAAVQTSSIAGG